MKTAKTLVELAQELERQRTMIADYVADTRALRVTTEDGSPRMAIQGMPVGLATAPAQIRPLALRQISEHCEIPAAYFDRMLEAAPALWERNVNHWLEATPARRMVRTLDTQVRAFLSERYRPLDNFDLANAVLPRLIDGGLRVESCELTERRLYIKAVQHGVEEEILPPGAAWGRGHDQAYIVRPGIVISNSEVGYGALAVEPAIYTVACTNLAVRRDMAVRKYHVGKVQGAGQEDAIAAYLSDRTKDLQAVAVFAAVADLVSATLGGDLFRRCVADLREAVGRKIEGDPVRAVEVFAANVRLTEPERGSVLRHLIEGGDLSQWGLSSAITRTAQDVADYDRASELEALGGNVIVLPARDWKVIAEAA